MFKYLKFLTCFIRGYTMGILYSAVIGPQFTPLFFFLIELKCLTFIWMSNDLYTACMRAQSLQSSPTFRDSMDCSLPGSSVHEIFPARILEWVAISSSRGSSWPRYQTCLSCVAGEFFFFFFNNFIYFCLCWVLVAACRLSLVTVSEGYSLLQYAGFSLQWLLLFQSTGSRVCGFHSCGMWPQ